MVPSRLFVLLLLAPLAVASFALLERSLLVPMIGLDIAILSLALLDAYLSRGVALQLRRDSAPVFSLGRTNRVTLHLESKVRRSLALSVTEDLFAGASAPALPLSLQLAPLGQVEGQYEVIPSRRGAYELAGPIVRYPSVLGLWIRQVRFRLPRALRVYPDLKRVRTFELLARQNREYALVRATRRKGGESEFARLRDYSRDDDYRAIDWKATARRQKLTAREYQLESNQNVLFMIDAGRMMSGEVEGLSYFDHALNATLMLAYVAARNGDKVGLVGFDDQVRAFVAPQTGPSASRSLIQASYHLHPRMVEPDYDLAFKQVAVRARQRALVILFTHVVDDSVATLLLRHARGLLRQHLPLIVLFRDVDLERLALGNAAPQAPHASAASPTSRRAGQFEDAPEELEPSAESVEAGSVDTYTQAAAAELLRWRSGIIRELKRSGALVLDVAPAELTGALINSYLEVKARHRL